MHRSLPAELCGHVWGASLSPDGALTVVVDSGSWASRLRYVTSELEPAVATLLSREVRRTVVRVRPRAGRPGSAG